MVVAGVLPVESAKSRRFPAFGHRAGFCIRGTRTVKYKLPVGGGGKCRKKYDNRLGHAKLVPLAFCLGDAPNRAFRPRNSAFILSYSSGKIAAGLAYAWRRNSIKLLYSILKYAARWPIREIASRSRDGLAYIVNQSSLCSRSGPETAFPDALDPQSMSDAGAVTTGRRQQAVTGMAFGAVGASLSPSYLRKSMSYLLTKKSKKSRKPSQQHIFWGIPTNIATGPLGFRTELGIGANGEQNCFRHDPFEDESDSAVAQGSENNGVSRIVFYDKKSDGQEPPASKIQTRAAVIGGSEREDGPTSASDPHSLERCPHESRRLSLSEENTSGAAEGEGEPGEVLRGTRHYRFGAGPLLTNTSCGERLEGHDAWDCSRSR